MAAGDLDLLQKNNMLIAETKHFKEQLDERIRCPSSAADMKTNHIMIKTDI